MTVRRTDPRAPGLTLSEAFVIFWRRRSPRRIGVLLSLVLGLRLALGGFTVWDLAVAGGLVLLHPLSEWLIHVFILHLQPQPVGDRVIDSRAARDHRAHHAAPHDPRWWFIPLSSGLVGFVVIATLARLLLPSAALAATAMVTAVALGLVYEWTHYLCHTSYRAKSRWLRRRQRLHRLHHFKNERYWMGVTMHAADHLLGTFPDPRRVATSPSCRDLGWSDGPSSDSTE